MSKERELHPREASGCSDRVGATRFRRTWETPCVIVSNELEESAATSHASADADVPS